MITHKFNTDLEHIIGKNFVLQTCGGDVATGGLDTVQSMHVDWSEEGRTYAWG